MYYCQQEADEEEVYVIDVQDERKGDQTQYKSSNNQGRPPTKKVPGSCYTCGAMDHYANRCPANKGMTLKVACPKCEYEGHCTLTGPQGKGTQQPAQKRVHFEPPASKSKETHVQFTILDDEEDDEVAVNYIDAGSEDTEPPESSCRMGEAVVESDGS